MSGDRALVRVVLGVALIAACVALLTCKNPVFDTVNAKSFGLIGTWVNPGGVNTGLYGFETLSIQGDGTYTVADNLASADSGTYTIDDVSVSGDSRTYHVHYVDSLSTDHYVITRITSGSAYESTTDGGTGQYPARIDSTDYTYTRASLR